MIINVLSHSGSQQTQENVYQKFGSISIWARNCLQVLTQPQEVTKPETDNVLQQQCRNKQKSAGFLFICAFIELFNQTWFPEV